MFFRLLLLFTVVPALELVLLIQLGRHVGFWPTAALVLGTGVVGAWLARREGVKVLRAVNTEMAEGILQKAKKVMERREQEKTGRNEKGEGEAKRDTGAKATEPPCKKGNTAEDDKDMETKSQRSQRSQGSRTS